MRIFFLFCVVALAALTTFAQTPAQIEKSLLASLDDVAKYGNYTGTWDDVKSEKANKQIKDTLIRNGKRADVLRYAFKKLKDRMFVATSADGKLRVYSWDTDTGGTMHDYASVYQYQGKSGKVYAWSDYGEGEDGGGAFTTEIFDVPAKTGTIYLLTSTFIASTSLNGQSISSMKIDGERLDRKARLIKTASGLTNNVGFEYDFFTVVDRPERPIKLFKFNAAKKEFSFPVVIEDEKTPQGRVTDKMITYRFNGTYFVKVK